MGAVVPGILLILLFIAYIAFVAWRSPEKAPAIITDENSAPMLGMVLKSLIPPLLLVFAVLGSIFFGIASPTESAAVGALGAMLLALTHKRLTKENLQQAMRETTKLTSMVFLILIGATTFGLVFRGMGGDELVHELMTGLPGGVWGFIIISMVLLFVLGFFLDFLEICFIAVPIIAPIAMHFGIDPLWFAILIAVNLQTSFLTPPFGFSLFYLKAAAPPEISMQQIYRGIVPFVVIQIVVLIMIATLPQLTTWLPGVMEKMAGL
jgi:tripartite ATP-independent transporter DctM subunit